MKYQAELLEREKRHKAWEERHNAWLERQKAREEREEARKRKNAEAEDRCESQNQRKLISSGEMAVGDGGKTIVVWRGDR